MRNAFQFVSLFSGAGGLDIGLEAAGWECAYASDNDRFAVETLEANRGRAVGFQRFAMENTFIEQADIVTLAARDIFAKAGLRKGNVELLAGGPPCQSWSSAGRQLGFNDPRGRLFDDFVRIADDLDARWLLLENVRGLLTARGPDGQPGSALTLIRGHLLKAGFQTSVGLLNAADFGVPQRRVRLFMIGFRAGDPPPFPSATHAKAPGSIALPEWISLGEALSSLSAPAEDEIIRPNEKLAGELAGIYPGSGIKSKGKTERTRPGGHWGYRQGCFVADLGQSARTVTASAQQDWIRDPKLGLRRLSPRECAALQGFSSDWSFQGNAQVQYRLIGNAVPPPLARAIGQELLNNGKVLVEKTTTPQSLLPLPPKLQDHVRYTAREEASNGKSRRERQHRSAPRLTGAL